MITRDEVRRTLGNALLETDGAGTMLLLLLATGEEDEATEDEEECCWCEMVNLGYSEKRTLLDGTRPEDSVSETRSGLESEDKNGGRFVRMRWKPVSGFRTVTTLRLLELSTGAELIGVVGLSGETVDEWCRSNELKLDSSSGVPVVE